MLYYLMFTTNQVICRMLLLKRKTLEKERWQLGKCLRKQSHLQFCLVTLVALGNYTMNEFCTCVSRDPVCII